MKTHIPEVTQIDVEAVKVFVHRAREKEGFEQLKASIADPEIGLKMPIQVRDISERPAAERKRPNGGCYKYELICGQGRLTAFRELGIKRIPALIVDAPEAEIVGRFLAENMMRKPLPWAEKARLVKADMDAGMSAEEVAARYHISPGHARKFAAVLNKTAQGLEDEVASLPMNEAEVLTTLPAEHQSIVVEVARETGDRQIRNLVRKAQQVIEEQGTLSVSALKQSLQRIDEDLKRARERLKLLRLHHSLGPQNIAALLEQKEFRAALSKAGVNVAKFEALSKA